MGESLTLSQFRTTSFPKGITETVDWIKQRQTLQRGAQLKHSHTRAVDIHTRAIKGLTRLITAKLRRELTATTTTTTTRKENRGQRDIVGSVT